MTRSDREAKRVGRPEVDSEAVNVRIERTILDLIDEWRMSREVELSRPKVVRHIIQAYINELIEETRKGVKMTPTERELLLLLAQMMTIEIAKHLDDAGLRSNEGRGGAFIRKINELSAKVKIEAEKS